MPSPRDDAADLPERGDVIAGKYQVEDLLGKGGMGVVVSARHLRLQQRVAVKFLLPKALSQPGASERFLREAQAASRIQSEHVARVLDGGTLESGSPYMVMEYLNGKDLSRTLKARGRLPVVEAVDFILQAGEAIAEAHTLGIIHRDLKPGNIFVTSRTDGSPFIKVLDFGLSKAMPTDGYGPVEMSLTATDAVIGSPPYMSPEQMRSTRDVDTRTDIWSLGVILYLLLAGRRPFQGESLPAMCVSIATDVPESLAKIRADVPQELEEVIFGCLEKDVDRRVQSVAELAHRLAPFGSPDARGSVERITRVSRSAAGGSTISSSARVGVGQEGESSAPPQQPSEPLAADPFLEANTIPTPGPMMDVRDVATATAQPSVLSQAPSPARRIPMTPLITAFGALVVIAIGAVVSRGKLRAPASGPAASDATVATVAAVTAPPLAPASSSAPEVVPVAPVASEAPSATSTASSAASASPAKASRGASPASPKPRGAPGRPKPPSSDPLERWK